MSKEFTPKDMQDIVAQMKEAQLAGEYILCGPLEMLEMELGPLEVRGGEVYRNDRYIGHVMDGDNVMVRV